MADPKFQERIRPDHERYSDEAEEQHTIARRFDHYVSHLLRGSTGLQRRHGRQDWTEQTADHEQHEVTHRGGDAVVASISEVVVADDHHVQPTDEQVGKSPDRKRAAVLEQAIDRIPVYEPKRKAHEFLRIAPPPEKLPDGSRNIEESQEPNHLHQRAVQEKEGRQS